jgi:hypothetical protein
VQVAAEVELERSRCPVAPNELRGGADVFIVYGAVRVEGDVLCRGVDGIDDDSVVAVR